MKHSTTLTLVVALTVILVGCAPDQTEELNRLREENAELRAAADPPPAALDDLFPPKADGPILLMHMHGMASSAMGMAADVMQGDTEGAQSNFDRFSQAYSSAAGIMPPEWSDKFPQAPVDSLGAALATGNPELVFAAFETVGQVCHDCHLVNMPKVQARYEWDNFRDLLVTDPVMDQEMPYFAFMQMVEMSLVGTVNDLGQGQVDEARAQFNDFNTRFQELKETCEFCHDTPRAYYVDDGSQARVDAITTALNAESPNPQEILHMVEEFGAETCHKCHKVHIPATYAKQRWEATH
jgi:cytochrome c556